jgi:predicted DNA-binding protein (MmcQ/YjbR family)
VDLATVRRWCTAHAGATEEHPFGPGVLVTKVGGRMFALVGEDDEPLTISLKVEPEIGEALRASYDGVAPGYHLNKRHWITVTLDGSVTDDEVRMWIEDSYDLVVAKLPRRVRESLA